MALAAAAVGTQGVQAYSQSYYAKQSVLDSGHWVRVKVSRTGMQEITAGQLRQWGFDDVNKVSVYGYGGVSLRNSFEGTLPDDLPQQPTMVSGDKLIFYGEGSLKYEAASARQIKAIRNHYSDGGYYFVTDSREPLKVVTSPFVPSDEVIERYFYVNYFEEDVQNPAEAGAFYFGPSYPVDDNGTTYTQSFRPLIEDYCPDKDMDLRWSVQLATDSKVGLKFHYGTQEAGLDVAPTTQSVCKYHVISRSYTASYNDNYATTGLPLSWTVTPRDPDTFTFAATDYWMYYYPRYARYAGQAELLMQYPFMYSERNYRVQDCRPGLQVWEVGCPTAVKALETRYNAGDGSLLFSPSMTYSYSLGYSGRIAVFDPAQQLNSVEYAGEASNSNLHGAPTPEMLIVSTSNCLTEAERLAGLHRRYQGLDVLVTTQEQVLNEFSSGTPDAMALRRLCRMFKDRGGSRFKYLLLMGAGTYDNRGIVSQFRQSDDLLVTYVAELPEVAGTTTSSYTCDAYFGILSDSDAQIPVAGYMDIAVGRIPTLNAGEAARVVDKIERYLTTAPDPEMYASAIVLGDDGDSNGHTEQQEEICGIITSRHPYMTVCKVYDNIYPIDKKDGISHSSRRVTTSRLLSGTSFFNYAGHGHNSAFTASQLWSKLLAKTTSYPRQPLAMLATCDSYAFDRLDDGIAYNMLINGDGGVIGVIGACRTVFKEHNHTLSKAVTRHLYDGSATTFGDVYRLAYNDIMPAQTSSTSGMNVKYNTACYNFGGDPALPLRRFTRGVTVTDINGTGVSGDGAATATITPKKLNTVSGVILDSKGNTDTSFNGSATVSIYDGPVTRRTLAQGDGLSMPDEIITYSFDETRLAAVKVPVKNGTFKASVYVPIPHVPDMTNRVVVTALADDNVTMAAGCTSDATVTEYDQNNVDVCTAPVIEQMYIDGPGFIDGSEIDGSFTLNALIDPGTSGLRVLGGTVAAPLSLSLDRNKSISEAASCYTLNDDGTVSLSVPVNQVTDGRHTLTLTVSSANDLNTSRTISFTVINRSATAALSVDEVAARTDMTFNLNHNISGTVSGRLVIEDNAGNVVRSIADCTFPYRWDLRDASGNTVADGTYRAYAIVSGGSNFASTPAIPVVVFK